MKKFAKILATSCLLLNLLAGCALTTDSIGIQYERQQGVSEIKGAEKVTVGVKVNDLRQDKSKVSSKKNGFGMEMAPIVAANDVSDTVQKAIEEELESRGFQLGEEAKVQINADLTRFYNDHKVGAFSGDAIADFNMLVVVKSKNGKTKYSRQISTQGVESNTMIMGGENAKLALNKALANGIRTLFDDQSFLKALRS